VLDITTTRSLRGQRVRVTKHTADGQDAVYGVLQGATGKTIWVAGLPIDVEAAPLMCSTCHRTATRLFVDDGRPTAVDGGPGVCAECYRKLAARRPASQEPCETPGCGGPGIRNPGTDVFLCTRCHAQAKSHLVLHGGANVVLAQCATEDVSSPWHVWERVRGARFRCVRCRTAEKYDPGLLKELHNKNAIK
jgi:hypothetical protein